MNNDLKLNMKIISNNSIDMKAESSENVNVDMKVGSKETDPIFRESPAYTITYQDINEWNNKSDFSGNYNDLINKPIIPNKTSQLTNDSGFINRFVSNLTNYSLTSSFSNVAFSGDYNDLINKPIAPTGAIWGNIAGTLSNQTDLQNALNDKQNLIDSNNKLSADLVDDTDTTNKFFSGNYNDLSNKPTIPTKTSDLNNDSGFITKSVNDLTNYTLSSSLATVATTGSYTDLTSTPTIPVVDNSVSTTSTNAVENQAITNYVDQIEEIGTSGGWIYRKWRNGISECYKNITPSGIAVNNAWGTGLYYGTVTGETFPTNLFIETPCINYTSIGGTSLICMNSSNASSTSTGDIQVARGTSNASASCTISIYAIGKWKV